MLDYFSEEETIPEDVTFFASGLLSKFGFLDGDLVSWVRQYDCSSHDTLTHIVTMKLVPMIPAKVEIQLIECCHNPIRAKSIDGEKVDWYGEETPARVREHVQAIALTMTGTEVLEIARQLSARTVVTTES